MRKKEEMMRFILGHFKYSLMRSWNRVDGYALKVKVWDMGFGRITRDFMYDALDTDDFYTRINDIVFDCQESLRGRFNDNIRIGFNGRSAGYLVLYHSRTSNNADQTYEEYELEEMGDADVRRVYNLLREFDKLKGIIKKECVYMAKNFKVEEVEVQYTKKEKVLAEL